jgi:hypothetical protein
MSTTRAPRVSALKGSVMTKPTSELGSVWWAKNLDDIDRELARAALICRVRLLDPGVIERVLKNDESVCGSRNGAGFRKLRDLLMMHYNLRERAVSAIGETKTAILIAEIVAKLHTKFGDHLGRSSPD